MNNYTFELCEQLHKEMWMWLSKNPGKNKNEWPRWVWNDGDIESLGPNASNCFACLMSMDFNINGECLFCKKCPIDWTDGSVIKIEGSKYLCNSYFAYYRLWSDTSDNTLRSELAEKIANLKWTKK